MARPPCTNPIIVVVQHTTSFLTKLSSTTLAWSNFPHLTYKFKMEEATNTSPP
uniref:Uncharacterized protein n=1 Tax=Rhizophora mucronata TaxID=61149 RepID=A0A2P2QIY8_RHIMU